MRTTASFQNTEKYELSITMCMTLEDWKSLCRAMDTNKWPASDLSRQIRDAVDRASTLVYVPAAL
jgi:hypothetical protein